MNKLKAYFNIGIQNGLQHRFQLFYWMLLNIFPVIAFLFVWWNVYEQVDTIQGYTLPMMMTYYVITRLINRTISTYSEIEIAREIKEGEINKHLLKPMSYFTYKFGERLGIRLITLIINIPLYIGIFFFFHQYFILTIDLTTGLLLLANILLSIHLFFLISYFFGMTAFFLTETHALFGIKDHLISILAGGLFPLQLLSPNIRDILYILPFPYFYSFPMDIYFHAISNTTIIRGFSIEVIWICIMTYVVHIMWEKGIRRYEAVGI